MPVSQQLISDIRELEAIRAEWTGLVERCPRATVFQRPEWLIPWWHSSGSGQMRTLAFRAQGRMVALAPMFVHEWNGRRQVTLIGNGVSDHLDLIAEEEFAGECAAGTLASLWRAKAEWDLCDFQDLPAESRLVRAAGPEDVSSAIPCAEIALPGCESEFIEGLPHGLRRNVRRYGDRLRSEHEVRFETFDGDHSGELLTALFRLHGARWTSKGEAGMLAGHERFFRCVTPVLASANLLRIHSLRIGDVIAGIIYQLRDGARAYGYITGFEPAFERYSPGTVLLDYAIRHAIREGAGIWDFLRGGESYKFIWGARERSKSHIVLGNTDK